MIVKVNDRGGLSPILWMTTTTVRICPLPGSQSTCYRAVMTENNTTDITHARVRLLALLLLECSEDDET
jgi:hypothetical protein